MLCFHQCCTWEARACSVIALPRDTFLVALALDSPGWPEQSGVTSGSCRSEKVPRGWERKSAEHWKQAWTSAAKDKMYKTQKTERNYQHQMKCKIINAETINLFGSAGREFNVHQTPTSSCKLQAKRLSCTSHFRGECRNIAYKKASPSSFLKIEILDL